MFEHEIMTKVTVKRKGIVSTYTCCIKVRQGHKFCKTFHTMTRLYMLGNLQHIKLSVFSCLDMFCVTTVGAMRTVLTSYSCIPTLWRFRVQMSSQSSNTTQVRPWNRIYIYNHCLFLSIQLSNVELILRVSISE